ncbi:ComEC/Rec2 family competence protein [Jannaschia sp. R86511]|uniref:ComEC/Rec2 family competence protein n=1 Tax=Jannaschia sp. R86511 TaxID=3093853 RepID=UPI0036D29A9C
MRTRGAVHDVRLVPAALLCWAAAWWAVAADPAGSRAAALALLGVGAAAALALATWWASSAGWFRRSARSARWLGPAAASLVLATALPAVVLGLASWQAERRAPAALVDVAERSGSVLVELVVAGDPVAGSGEQAWHREQVRVRVVVTSFQPPGHGRGTGTRTGTGTGASASTGTGTGTGTGHAVTVRVPASLSGDPSWQDARWGERLRVRLSLEPAPAGAPYTFFARPSGPVERLSGPAWWWQWAEQLRAGLVTAAGADGGAGDGGAGADAAAGAGPAVTDGAALLPGLVVGDTSAQPADLVADMRTAGLTHLTAVSGANVSIVCGGVLLVCVLGRLGVRTGVVLAAVALLGLVVVARPEPSVLRAAVMGSVGLLGLLLGRRGGGVSALALAVLVVLLVDPWLSRAPGFRLSVLATGALVLCSLPWARSLGRVLPRPMAFVLAVPAAAQAAVTPSLVGLEPVLSLYALPANVLAAPAVAPATVIGVVAALLAPLHPALAAVVATPARWCAAWIAVVARTAADLPAASLPWPSGAAGSVLAGLATLTALVLAAWLLRRLPDRRAGAAWAPWPDVRSWPRAWTGRDGPPDPAGRSRSRRFVTVALPGVTALALALALLLPPAGDRWPGAGWQVVVCDVGQGEALLVRAGPAAAVVVDTGPAPELVAGCLRRSGVREVPLLVLTHLHADHVGGLDGVAGVASVGTVWSAGAGMPEPAADALSNWSSRHGAVLRHPVRGDAATVGDVDLQVLSPVAGRARPGDSQDVNDAGLVVRASTGGLTLLAAGDVGSPVQQRLLAAPEDLRAHVTTVAHHGSADQLPAFYAAVGARVGVASAGRGNGYGHPSPRALSVVGASGTLALSTLQHGGVALRLAAPDVPDAPDAPDASVAVRTSRAGARRRAAVPA